MVELQRAQQRRKKYRRVGVVAIIVLIAIGLAVYSGTRGSSKKKTTTATAAPIADRRDSHRRHHLPEGERQLAAHHLVRPSPTDMHRSVEALHGDLHHV